MKKVYNLLRLKYNDVFESKHSLVVLKGFTVIMIVGLLALTSYLQRDFIKLYETPPTIRCYYYDEYGNYIHGSRFLYGCPELDIMTKTDQTLKVRAEYNFIDDDDQTLHSHNGGPYYTGKDGYAIVDIEIQYNEDHFVTSYTAKTSLNYELLEFSNTDSIHNASSSDRGTFKKYYSSLLLSIKTTYNGDRVSQTKQFYTKELDNITYDQIEDIEHYDFTDSEPSYQDSLELIVTDRNQNYIEFEIYNTLDEEKQYIRYLGHIDYSQDIELFYEVNPERLNDNIQPKEYSFKYLINDYNGITKTVTSGSTFDKYRYDQFKDYEPIIQTGELLYSNHGHVEYERNIVELNNFIVLEGKFNAFKMYQTSYGYKVEEFYGDNERAEVPYSDDYDLTRIHNGVDGFVFDNNPIQLEYDMQPIFNLNPMLNYTLDQSK